MAITFKKINNGRYHPNSDLFFDTELGTLKLTPRQALEIAYTLCDDFEIDYKIIEDIETRIEEIENGNE